MARASKEAVVVVIDTSASMAEPYPIKGERRLCCAHFGWLCTKPSQASPARTPSTHPQTKRTGLAAEEGPPPSKLDVAKELATLMLADRAVAEQVGLPSHTPSIRTCISLCLHACARPHTWQEE